MVMDNQTKIVDSGADDRHIRHIRLSPPPNACSVACALTQAAAGPAHGRP
jgi:hypothetical protein